MTMQMPNKASNVKGSEPKKKQGEQLCHHCMSLHKSMHPVMATLVKLHHNSGVVNKGVQYKGHKQGCPDGSISSK